MSNLCWGIPASLEKGTRSLIRIAGSPNGVHHAHRPPGRHGQEYRQHRSLHHGETRQSAASVSFPLPVTQARRSREHHLARRPGCVPILEEAGAWAVNLADAGRRGGDDFAGAAWLYARPCKCPALQSSAITINDFNRQCRGPSNVSARFYLSAHL